MSRPRNRLAEAIGSLPRDNDSSPAIPTPVRAVVAAPARQSAPQPVIDLSEGYPEAELCDRLGSWLRERGYEVFFEVPVLSFQPDILAFGTDVIAIEAKVADWRGVIEQGLRSARHFERAYVALPFEPANRAAAELTRQTNRAGQSGPAAWPGVLGLHRLRVVELVAPSGRPDRPIDRERLYRAAGRYGKERGGVPSSSQLERNVELWRGRINGATLAELAGHYRLSSTGVSETLNRLDAWRDHLRRCPSEPCVATARRARAFYAFAHRHSSTLLDLSGDLPARRKR